MSEPVQLYKGTSANLILTIEVFWQHMFHKVLNQRTVSANYSKMQGRSPVTVLHT